MTENKAIEWLRAISSTQNQSSHSASLSDRKEALYMAIQALKESQQYRAMEERLKKVYGECDGLLETVISSLERHENLELPSTIVKSVLITDEDVDKWNEYKAIGNIEEFKALKEKMQDVEIAIIDRMQEFYDEYRSISQSSVDHFGGKADAIETSQKIVKGVFKDLLGLDWSE